MKKTSLFVAALFVFAIFSSCEKEALPTPKIETEEIIIDNTVESTEGNDIVDVNTPRGDKE